MVRLTIIKLYSSANSIKQILPNFLSENSRVTAKNKNFVDSLKVVVQGGDGGTGLPSFGGRGGNGGNVIFKCDKKIESLKNLKNHLIQLKSNGKKLKAESGENSGKYKLIGNNGKDIIINCPPGCTIKNENKGYIGEIDYVHQQVKIPLGGEGGSKKNNYIGRLGSKMNIIIDMKLISDIGLVGFPNAGKSTLLKALTRAKPQIANFPFTTITPNIGIINYSDYRKVSLADLPGLIKGSHLDFGLGHKFLKHAMRTKLLIFVISTEQQFTIERKEGYSPIEILITLIKEIELYDETILNKPAILVMSKYDLLNSEKIYEKFLQDLERVKNFDYSNINLSEEYLPKRLIDFDFVLPVSSKISFNIPELREKLRTQLDLHFEEELKAKGKLRTFAAFLQREKERKMKQENENLFM